MYVKARGLYNLLSQDNKDLYDSIIAKTKYDLFKNFTKKELAYLFDLYEYKVTEIVKQSKTKVITSEDVYTLAMSIKLRNLLRKRKIAITQTRYNSNMLDSTDKQFANIKLYRTKKQILR